MHYLVYLSICVATILTPGPAVVLTINNSARYGLKKATIGILGNITATSLLGAVSAAGLGAIILASTSLFNLIKISGGLYLIYLGIKALRTTTISKDTMPAKQLAETSALQLYREAFLVSMSNPKAIAFFTAIFPQFIDPNQALWWQFFILAGTFAASSFTGLVFYAALASNLKRHLERQQVVRWFNRVTGGVFIGFSAALLASTRT